MCILIGHCNLVQISRSYLVPYMQMPTLLCWLEGYSVGQFIITPTLQSHHYQNSSQQSRMFHSKFSHGWEPRLEGSGKQHQCLKDDFQTFQYFTLHSCFLVLCHTGVCRLICVQSWGRGARKTTQPVLARLFQRKLWLLPALQKSSQLAQQLPGEEAGSKSLCCFLKSTQTSLFILTLSGVSFK